MKRVRPSSRNTKADNEEAVRKLYVEAAHRLHHKDGEIEIDSDAKLSIAYPPDGGAYVAAWVWVPMDEIRK